MPLKDRPDIAAFLDDTKNLVTVGKPMILTDHGVDILMQENIDGRGKRGKLLSEGGGKGVIIFDGEKIVNTKP